ncbi:MAG: N-acetylmuramoyl-L-alanine amidase [Aerococcus sp.]|nr:N-acetylmuramoyl-L-alanine amidase [Aerococcus sp.]
MKYTIETRHKINDGKAGYYRHSKPEGVVIHSSANKNDSLEGEINYMLQNQNEAFTHAWAGVDKIVEITNTDYPCWGAGPSSNARFVQIEVIENRNLGEVYGDTK